MWKSEHIIETKALREAVWRIWEDVPGWMERKRARLDRPFEDGARGGLKLRGSIGALHARVAPRFALEEVLPGESFTLSQRIPFGRRRNRHELAETGAVRVRITHRMMISDPLASLYVRAIGTK